MNWASTCAHMQVTRLRYTPRKLLIHPEHNTLIIGEADHAAIPLAEREDLAERAKQEGVPLQVRTLTFSFLFVLCVCVCFVGVCTVWSCFSGLGYRLIVGFAGETLTRVFCCEQGVLGWGRVCSCFSLGFRYWRWEHRPSTIYVFKQEGLSGTAELTCAAQGIRALTTY
jgi:hypothetical protein